MITEILPSLFVIGPKRKAPHTPVTYLLRRAAGSILLATKADLAGAEAGIKKLGGVAHVLLGDRHHALPHTQAFAERLGVGLTCSDVETKALKTKGVAVTHTLPCRAAAFAPDFEIIPTPGHTPGALSYIWTHDGERRLFIGDTLVPVDGAWRYWVTKPNLAKMRETVRALAKVKFDVILSNSFAAKPNAWFEMNARDRLAMFKALDAELSL
jgi:glyoxylase-like metal-dependent hydrolase (beta-lactamase superfamily II)